MSGALLLGLPGAVFLSLALLPPGRQALWGLAVAAVLAAAFRAATGDAGLALLAGAGVALAAVAQGLRAVLGERLNRLAYLAMLPLLYLVALLIVQRFVGA
jgi:hypothetical protein